MNEQPIPEDYETVVRILAGAGKNVKSTEALAATVANRLLIFVLQKEWDTTPYPVRNKLTLESTERLSKDFRRFMRKGMARTSTEASKEAINNELKYLNQVLKQPQVISYPDKKVAK